MFVTCVEGGTGDIYVTYLLILKEFIYIVFRSKIICDLWFFFENLFRRKF